MTDENTPLPGSDNEPAPDTATDNKAEPTETTKTTDKPEAGKTPEPTDQDGDEAKAEGDDSDDDGDKGDEPEKPKKKSVPASKRIPQLLAQRNDAESRARAAEEQVKRLEQRIASYAVDKPRPDDFDSNEEYQAKLTAYESAQWLKKDRESEIETASEAVKAARTEADSATKEAFQERAEEFAATATDYHDVVSDPRLSISDPMAAQIMRSESGPQVAYWLGKNRAEAARIARIGDATEVAREIGRIEGRLSTPPPRRTTQAPSPIAAVATGAGSRSEFDPAAASMEEYVKWRKAGGKG